MSHLRVGDHLTLRIGPEVQFTAHAQAGCGARGADEIHDDRELTRGCPRQFVLMYEKRRCSILFHLLVPRGK
jgi:hypothetical protein